MANVTGCRQVGDTVRIRGVVMLDYQPLSRHTASQYDEDWHPCTFPYTSPSASFNYRNQGDNAEFDDDSCSITYAASTGSLHFISCVVHTR